MCQLRKEFGDPHGLKITYTPMIRTDEVTTLNVWMAGGTAPDLIYTYDINVVQNYLRQGGLADLTDAVAEYGQDLIAYIGEDQQATGLIDGRQMFLVGRRVVDNGIVGSAIRGD